jgi:hypothetical protein
MRILAVLVLLTSSAFAQYTCESRATVAGPDFNSVSITLGDIDLVMSGSLVEHLSSEALECKELYLELVRKGSLRTEGVEASYLPVNYKIQLKDMNEEEIEAYLKQVEKIANEREAFVYLTLNNVVIFTVQIL